MTTVELYGDILTASGGDPASVPDNLKTTLMKEIIIAQGGSVDDLPDELETTFLKRIAETAASSVTAEKKGASVVFDKAVAFPLIGLNVYGKSTQNGTPIPEAPVDIVNVGDDGAVVVTVNDGGDNSLSASITSALPLCGIPVTSGGNYTDNNGQQWICDEVIYHADGTGKIVKNCVKFAPDTVSTVALLADGTTFRITFVCPMPYGDAAVRAKTLCSHALYHSDWAQVNRFCYFSSSSTEYKLLIQVPASLVTATTKEGAQEWLDNNKVVFVYALATPEEIELTADEVAQLKALCSYNGVTNAFNDENAEMAVRACTSQDAVDLVNMFG